MNKLLGSRTVSGMARSEKISKMTKYKEELVNRYWAYQQRFFPQIETYFERPFAPDRRLPVFLVPQVWHNVITNPEATSEELSQLLSLLPSWERHKWFRSMNSSQALAQSVLGNLTIYNHLNCLTELNDDEGKPLFGAVEVSPENFAMEHKINHLGEPRRTSFVVLIYDERNPAFQVSGSGLVAFAETRQALKVSRLLKKCSWQRIVRHLKKKGELIWLTKQLELKYGLT